MNELADIIIAKLEVKQQQWDEEFHSSINDIHGTTATSKEVRNPFSNETYELNGLELSIYDFIMGCNLVFERMPNTMTTKRINEFQKALTWFRVNNPEAYYVLLD